MHMSAKTTEAEEAQLRRIQRLGYYPSENLRSLPPEDVEAWHRDSRLYGVGAALKLATPEVREAIEKELNQAVEESLEGLKSVLGEAEER
jgi:hypothetical protein